MNLLTNPIVRLCSIATVTAFVSGTLVHAADPLLSYKSEIIAKAIADECFFGINDPENPNEYKKAGIDCEDCILRGGEPKANQSYVWGMVRKDNYLWWGTGPNVNRLVASAYLGSSSTGISRSNSRNINFSVVEYGESRFAQDGAKDYDAAEPMLEEVDAVFGDWRPPSIYCYNLDTNAIERKDLLIESADTEAWALLWRTVGLRSAGYTPASGPYTEGLVILAGPNLSATTGQAQGVSMFAFDAATREFVAAKDFPNYTNIRKWKFHDNEVYTAIATDTGSGQVIRWRNNPSHVDYPLGFQVVGNLNAGGAELEIFDDGDGPRLYVSTWPGIEGNLQLDGDVTTILNLINAPAGLWRSPVIPDGGRLNAQSADGWNLVWSVVDYEPDLVVGLHYGGGALAAFDGYLYWGTMHVPGTSLQGHSIGYGSPDPVLPRPDPYPEDPEDPARVAYEEDQQRYQDESFADFINSYRSISIWRGRNFTNSGGDIELLYGKSKMPVRMKRSTFMTDNDPKGEFNIQWAYFFSQNIGNLRNVSDGEQQPYYPTVLSAQLNFLNGTPPTDTTLLEDGGDWDGGFASYPEILAQQPNVGGYEPLWGPEGITENTTFYSSNNYTWAMQVFGGKLYIGTMDWDDINTPDEQDGAHLYVIPDSSTPAIPVTRRGMANWSSYGIRTIAADDSRGELYLGMANVNNLLSTKVGDPQDGGWELQRVTLRYEDEDFDELEDDWEESQFGDINTVNSATGNSDQDPMNDYDEWVAGTNPNDSNSFFFTAVDNADSEGMHEIEWASITNRYYTVYETVDLSSSWSPVATYMGTGSTLTHEYDPSLSNAKFFKVAITLDAPTP